MVFRPGDWITVAAGDQGAWLMIFDGATLNGPPSIWWNFVASPQARIERPSRMARHELGQGTLRRLPQQDSRSENDRESQRYDSFSRPYVFRVDVRQAVAGSAPKGRHNQTIAFARLPVYAFAPPSTVRVLPVTMFAAGPARKTTASAISCGSA